MLFEARKKETKTKNPKKKGIETYSLPILA